MSHPLFGEREVEWHRYMQAYQTFLSNTNHLRSGWHKQVDGEDGQLWVEAGLLMPNGQARPTRQVIWSIALERDDQFWLHCSIMRPDAIPSYEDLVWLHGAFMPGGVALQLFVPRDKHINIQPNTLHLWSPLEHPVVPDFTRGGRSI